MDNRIRLISIVLAIVGLIDSIYLVWLKYTDQYALCGPIGNCESVNTSQYSEIGGIPIALLGAGAYLVIIILLLLEVRSDLLREYSPLLVFGISLAGTLYSIYLTYIEVAVLRAICPYCVVSAVVLVLLLFFSTIRLIQTFRESDI